MTIPHHIYHYRSHHYGSCRSLIPLCLLAALAFAWAPAAQAQQTDSASSTVSADMVSTDSARQAPQENKALVRRFVEEVQNQHNLAAVDELFSPNFVNRTPVGEGNYPPNIEGVKAHMAALITGFPDMHVTIHQQIAEGDKVVTYKAFSGTHRGEFGGIPATGNEVAFEVIDIFTVDDGKFTEHWAVAEVHELRQQLRAASPAEQGN